MFIIDTFEYNDGSGNPIEVLDQEKLEPAIGGGGTYCAIGARIWLPATELGMIVDRGHDFPRSIQASLDLYGDGMWLWRDHSDKETTKAVNIYTGDTRGFAYLTPRIRLTPKDLTGTSFDRPKYLHFICSPQRAKVILDEIGEIQKEGGAWDPICVYEPIPDRCVPEELPPLKAIISGIDILSPNAEEALSLLSTDGNASNPAQPSPALIEAAAQKFISFGARAVVIRSGALGAYCLKARQDGVWIPAFFSATDVGKESELPNSPTDHQSVVDVTGAGNAFLGGLVAGLELSSGDLVEACLYATVSASYTIEQKGLPILTTSGQTPANEIWNGSHPSERLASLRQRVHQSALSAPSTS
ncbi:Ribokinase-like protein [Clavulina sp. PMI_390]|nr:Ribokinase-like protein [Clavulina sp. PMI_390]